jgi:ketosteroid isomerase-like protein
MSGQDRAQRMRDYYKTYNSADPEALKGFYAEDVVLTSANGVIDGREALLATYGGIISILDDKMTPTRVMADGDVAMVEVEDVLTAKVDVPDFLGASLKAGQAMTLKLAGVYEFQGDAIKRITLYAR